MKRRQPLDILVSRTIDLKDDRQVVKNRRSLRHIRTSHYTYTHTLICTLYTHIRGEKTLFLSTGLEPQLYKLCVRTRAENYSITLCVHVLRLKNLTARGRHDKLYARSRNSEGFGKSERYIVAAADRVLDNLRESKYAKFFTRQRH